MNPARYVAEMCLPLGDGWVRGLRQTDLPFRLRRLRRSWKVSRNTSSRSVRGRRWPAESRSRGQALMCSLNSRSAAACSAFTLRWGATCEAPLRPRHWSRQAR